MKLAPYSEYKESGAPWLGKIPAHWEVKPGMAFLSQKKEKNVGMKESTVLSLSYGQIVVKPPEKLHGLVPESFETYQIANPGNIVIRGTDLQNDKTSLRVGKVRDRGIITSAYLCLQTNEKINPDYAHLLLHGYDLMKIYYGMGSGLRQNLDFSDFKRLPILWPTGAEQTKIVSFLNWQTAQINKFIRNKRRLIELLKEQKQNIINQAVTRGLDPNVKLKPSGVEWIGDIPEHWEVSRVKREFHCLNNQRIPLSATERGAMKQRLYDYYGASGVIDKVDEYIFDDELLLIAEDGANLVLRNLQLAIIARGKFWVNNHAHILKPKIGNIEFLAHCLEQIDYRPWISGAAQPKLTKDRLMAIYIAVPSRKEQDEIVKFIKQNTATIDYTITRAEREIELMREYRTRLISDVVTGQVDVRGIEVPDVAEDELLALEEDTAESDDVIDDEGDMDETD